MRHLKVGKKLGRTSSHRKATLRALSASLIKHHRIVTTLAKAKELRRFVEPVITKAKEDTSHHRQQAFAFLQDKEAVTHLFEEVGALVADRPGGYTRVIKLGPRQGDGSETAMIELVDYNDVKPEGGKSTRKRTRRGGRSRNKATAKPAEQKKKTETVEEVAEAKTEEKAETKAKAKPVAKPEDAKTPEPETETKSSVEEVKEEAATEAKKEETDSEKKTDTKAENKAGDKKEESDKEDSSDKK